MDTPRHLLQMQILRPHLDLLNPNIDWESAPVHELPVATYIPAEGWLSLPNSVSYLST